MKPYFLLILSLYALCGCQQDDDLPSVKGANVPIDLGVYEADTTHSDVFCDFIWEENTGCWDSGIEVYKDCHYNLLFTRYGGGWTGADATYSIGLPDGRILWMFGDTFLGSVRSDRSRDGSPFIRNSFILQDGDEMVTYYQGTTANPSAMVSPPDSDEWYWPLDGTVYDGEIQMLLGRLGSSGSGGMWDFGYRGFDLAVFSLTDLTLLSLETVIDDPEISYGSAVVEDDDYIYIYGISTNGLSKKAHLARAPGGDLRTDWTFYNGTDWTDQPSSYAVLQDVSDQFSVFKDGGKFYLCTHQIIFGSKIFLYESDAPEGPWSNKRTLYCTPESGGDIFTYNSFVHPELSEEGELRISYNVNSFDFNDLFENADNYRPWFISVKNWKN